MRPAAYVSAGLVGVFTAVAIQQGLSSSQASSEAAAMVGPGGSLAPGSDPAVYDGLRSDARAAVYDGLRSDARASARNAYLAGGAAVVFAVTAGVLGWKSRVPTEEPAALALRF
jgi:hypothetical protein